MRLRKSLRQAFPEVEIIYYSAGKITKKIEVSWVDKGKKKIVWAKGKADT